MKTNVMVAVLAMALGGCRLLGGDGDPDGGDTLTDGEIDTFEKGAEPMVVTQHLAVLADSFFAFDPTIDPISDALANAARIRDRMLEQLSGGDGGASCGMVSLSGTTLTVDFGAGCKLGSNLKVSGSASAGVQKSGAVITVTLTFTTLKVNGKDLDGTASFATSNGTSFTVNANLTSLGTTLIANDLVVRGTRDSIIIDSGSLAARKAGGTSTLTFHTVAWKPAECYPNSGSVQVKLGSFVETFIFDAQTPQTGVCTVKVGRKTAKKSLPAYGNCPPASDGGAS